MEYINIVQRKKSPIKPHSHSHSFQLNSRLKIDPRLNPTLKPPTPKYKVQSIKEEKESKRGRQKKKSPLQNKQTTQNKQAKKKKSKSKQMSMYHRLTFIHMNVCMYVSPPLISWVLSFFLSLFRGWLYVGAVIISGIWVGG